MDGVYSVIDLWFTTILSTYNCLSAHAGVYFTIWFAVIVVIPLFRRIIRALKS